MTNCTVSLKRKKFKLDQENEVLWEGVLQRGSERVDILFGLLDDWKILIMEHLKEN